MELACKHIIFLHGSMDMCTVICGGFHDLRIGCLQIIGVNEVNIGSFCDSAKQSAIILQMK